MDVIMGLLAAGFWGGTDFFIGINARRVGVRRAVLYAQLIGFLFICITLAFSAQWFSKAALVSAPNWALAVLAAAITLAGSLCLSRAFATGKTAVIAPLATSYGAVTTWLNWLSGEKLSCVMLIGLALCLFGVMMGSVSRADKEARLYAASAPYFAALAALFYGIGFWLQGRYTLPTLGAAVALLVNYAVGLCILMLLTLRVNTVFFVPSLAQILLLLAASLLNLGGFATFALGAGAGSVSVVTVLSTLSGGVAAILGAVLLRERLSTMQLTGVLLVMAGAVLLHV